MKKLIPALVLLLVSAIVLSTSSYAWFSMNTQVTASGMEVTAKAPASLLISTDGTNFGATAVLSDTEVAEKISPTYYNKKYLFAKLNDNGMALVNQDGKLTGAAEAELISFKNSETFPAGTTCIVATDADYFKDELWLKYDGEEGTVSIKVRADFTDNSSALAIKNAMHVLLVPDEDAGVVDIDMSDGSTGATLTTLTANADAKKYVVYYFLDGEDPDCKNTNITGDAILSVELTFSIVSID
jgi:hypothetical protein